MLELIESNTICSILQGGMPLHLRRIDSKATESLLQQVFFKADISSTRGGAGLSSILWKREMEREER